MRCIRAVTSGHIDSCSTSGMLGANGSEHVLTVSCFNEATTERSEKQQRVDCETHIGCCADHPHLAVKAEKIKNSKQACWICSGICCHTAFFSLFSFFYNERKSCNSLSLGITYLFILGFLSVISFIYWNPCFDKCHGEVHFRLQALTHFSINCIVTSLTILNPLWLSWVDGKKKHSSFAQQVREHFSV